MRIVIFEAEQWERDAFSSLGPKQEVTVNKGSLTPDTASSFQDAEIISTFIYSTLGADVLKQFPNLKMISTRSTGVDHIDLDYCRSKGITVSNVPSYGSNTVAEHTFALLLAISHRIVDAVDRTRRGEFTVNGLRGFDLRGRTLGVVGTGDIGESVIEIAKGFGMRIVAFDVKPREELRERLHFEYADLDTLLSRADVLTLHVPAIPQTRNMISSEQFERMKDGAVLINTSRGGIVNTKALARALAEGKIHAAGLDVLPEEPTMREEAELLRSVYQKECGEDLFSLLANNVMIRMRNVIVTPHSAFYTTEALDRITGTTIDNIQAFIRGEPINVAGSGE